MLRLYFRLSTLSCVDRAMHLEKTELRSTTSLSLIVSLFYGTVIISLQSDGLQAASFIYLLTHETFVSSGLVRNLQICRRMSLDIVSKLSLYPLSLLITLLSFAFAFFYLIRSRNCSIYNAASFSIFNCDFS